MNQEDRMRLEELDRINQHRTRREWSLTAAIIVVGTIIALLVGHEIAASDDNVRSIKCEQGDVVLVLERGGGQYDRVECPAGAQVKP